jgi:HK97 family phage major capsid protein
MDYLPRGLNFVRRGIAMAAAPTGISSTAYAATRWGAKSRPAMILRAAVAGGGASSGEWGAELADADADAAEFLEVVRPLTVLDRLQGLRRVPVRTPFVATAQGSTAHWRREGAAAKVSASAFNRESMVPLNLDALQVISDQLLRDAAPESERLILNDMAAATAEASDRAFLDRANGGVPGVTPAAITYGAIEVAATGSLADDIEAMLGAFSGSLQTASFVLHPRLAASIGLRAGGRGVAADLGAIGGTLAGLPALVSEACELDSDGVGDLILLDAGSICVCDTGADITRSTQGTVEMDDAPQGDSLTPVASSANLISLFQTDSTGLLVTRRVNWKLARQSAVVVLTGAGYYAAS